MHVAHKVGREPQSKEHYTDEQELNRPTIISFVLHMEARMGIPY